MQHIRRILVATDFSEVSERVLDRAIDLATQLEARIYLVHAYEPTVYGLPQGALIASEETSARIMAAAREALEAAARRCAERGVFATILLRTGVVWEEVNAVADEEKIDLIVVGTHGRRGLSRVLLGSVAEKIVRTATRPVLVMRGEYLEGAPGQSSGPAPTP